MSSKTVVIFLFVIGSIPVHAHSAKTHQDPQLTLTITGKAEAKSNRVLISAQLTTKASTASKAMVENARKISAMLKILKKAGEGNNSLSTSPVSVNQEFLHNSGDRKPDGFSARNEITVRLKDVRHIAMALDSLSSLQATNVSGPTFAIDDDRNLIKKARRDALKKAAELSSSYAKSAGFKRAQLISINESGYSSGAQRSASRLGGTFMPGGNESSATSANVVRTLSINVEYRLVN